VAVNPATNGAHESPPPEGERTGVPDILPAVPEADARSLQPADL
jgi:hypothetical protein